MLKRIKPLTFVTVAIQPTMNSMTFDMSIPPFTTVTIAIFSFPNTKARFYTLVPLTFIYFSVWPSVKTLSMCFVILEQSNVFCSIGKYFKTSTISQVLAPFSLINAATRIDKNTEAFSLILIIKTTHIKRCFMAFYFEIRLLRQRFKIKKF